MYTGSGNYSIIGSKTPIMNILYVCYTKCVEISLVCYLYISYVSVYVDIFQIDEYPPSTNYHTTRYKFPPNHKLLHACKISCFSLD